jgi:biotin-dependent carboxylase-like uncharacterized protein
VSLVVEAVGPLATIQDLGRPGHARLGVTSGGAADRGALRLANRLLGNNEGAAAVEALMGGLTLRAKAAVLVAVTGAPAPVTVDGHPAPLVTPVRLGPGEVLHLGMPVTGLRTYVAVRGGFDVPLELGSASTDQTSGLGPEPLRAGTVLAIRPARGSVPALIESAAAVPAPSAVLTLHAVLGPRDDWFPPGSVHLLRSVSWTVSADSDRVGVRLSGPSLARRTEGELPSEGVLRGAVQVPSSGHPLVFLADHPTTGGYPVLAVVGDADVDRLAQTRPGDQVRFELRHATWS